MGTTREQILNDPQYSEAHSRLANDYRQTATHRNRRLTENPEPIKRRTEQEKMADMAVVRSGNSQIQTAWENKDQLYSQVVAAYKSGSESLSDHQIKAVCAIAWNMQLDPSPGAGHIYAWKQGNKFILTIGYQGYIHKAQQDHQFFYNPPREMTEAEKQLHGLSPNDIGAVVELYDMKRAEMAKSIGIPVTPIVGTAVWSKGDNIPKARSAFWVAGKNAIKDAIRQLGLGFAMVIPPEVSEHGFYYDRTQDSFIQELSDEDANIVEGTVADSAVETPVAEPAPVVKRNGKHGDGKPSYTVISEPEAVIDNGAELAEILEADDPIEVVEDVEELPPLGKQQIGKIRHTINKTFSNPDERASVEAEIVATYSAESLETVPSIRFKEIIATLESKQPKLDANGKPNGAAALPRNKLASPLEITEMNVLIKEYLIILDELPADESKQGDAIKAKFVELFDKEPAMIERSKVYWIKDQITQKTMEVVKAQNAESES